MQTSNAAEASWVVCTIGTHPALEWLPPLCRIMRRYSTSLDCLGIPKIETDKTDRNRFWRFCQFITWALLYISRRIPVPASAC